MPSSLISIAGYRLIRPIGSGGFGTVWLARAEALDQYCAIKILHVGQAHRPDKELAAVRRFKALALTPVASALMPIEHVGTTPEGRLFYVMPLADGPHEFTPADPTWHPVTLGEILRTRAAAPEVQWFSATQIINWITPIARAAAALGEAELVHRDIKPDNILFMGGRSVLSDVSLLTADSAAFTEIGTPGYRAPSWYMETGGNPDLYGLAATLFTVLTGHSPDKLGRAAFLWPSGGKKSIAPRDWDEWARLHRVIFRATHERAAERFHSLAAFADALEAKKTTPSKGRRQWVVGAALTIVLGLAAGTYFIWPSVAAPLLVRPASTASNQAGHSWDKFDEEMAVALSEIDSVESDWHLTREVIYADLKKLKTVEQISDLEALIQHVVPYLARANKLPSIIEPLKIRWMGERLNQLMRNGISTDQAVDGWKAHDSRKHQLALLEERIETMRTEGLAFPAGWEGELTFFIENFELSRPKEEIRARVLVMLKAVSPLYKDAK